MTDRDRLIELLKQGNRECSQKSLAEIKKILNEKHSYNSETDKPFNLWEALADYLLANGVIVPPCKVGDKLYIIASISQEIIESVVIGMWIVEDSISILTIHGTILNDSLGKTVFLTKEEAEAKLKECKSNG